VISAGCSISIQENTYDRLPQSELVLLPSHLQQCEPFLEDFFDSGLAFFCAPWPGHHREQMRSAVQQRTIRQRMVSNSNLGYILGTHILIATAAASTLTLLLARYARKNVSSSKDP
jgi:hypothetical protein